VERAREPVLARELEPGLALARVQALALEREQEPVSVQVLVLAQEREQVQVREQEPVPVQALVPAREQEPVPVQALVLVPAAAPRLQRQVSGLAPQQSSLTQDTPPQRATLQVLRSLLICLFHDGSL